MSFFNNSFTISKQTDNLDVVVLDNNRLAVLFEDVSSGVGKVQILKQEFIDSNFINTYGTEYTISTGQITDVSIAKLDTDKIMCSWNDVDSGVLNIKALSFSDTTITAEGNTFSFPSAAEKIDIEPLSPSRVFLSAYVLAFANSLITQLDVDGLNISSQEVGPDTGFYTEGFRQIMMSRLNSDEAFFALERDPSAFTQDGDGIYIGIMKWEAGDGASDLLYESLLDSSSLDLTGFSNQIYGIKTRPDLGGFVLASFNNQNQIILSNIDFDSSATYTPDSSVPTTAFTHISYDTSGEIYALLNKKKSRVEFSRQNTGFICVPSEEISGGDIDTLIAEFSINSGSISIGDSEYSDNYVSSIIDSNLHLSVFGSASDTTGEFFIQSSIPKTIENSEDESLSVLGEATSSVFKYITTDQSKSLDVITDSLDSGVRIVLEKPSININSYIYKDLNIKSRIII